MSYTITARFQDRNQPALSVQADTWPQATAAASHLAGRLAALKAIHVDDFAAGKRHVACPTAGGLEYLFTCPLPSCA